MMSPQGLIWFAWEPIREGFKSAKESVRGHRAFGEADGSPQELAALVEHALLLRK